MDPDARDRWEEARPRSDHPVRAACVAPWVSLEFDPSGWVYACCTSGMYPLGRIGEDRLGDLWAGPRAEVLRSALEAWDLSVGCSPCRWHLEHGRMDPVAAVYDRYEIGDKPYVMVLALSNRCNLGCVMCSAELSSTIRHEQGLAPLPAIYDDQFFEDLRPFLEEVRLLKFLGGEPFLAPENKRIWSMLEELDDPPRLQITTNGTVWTDQVRRLLERFEVDISVSVDAATPETYAAVRRGGDLETVMRNLDRFADACASRGTQLHVSYCLMEQNAHELADFLAWADRFEVAASINLVTDPGLALHDLDLRGLEQVQHRWRSDVERTGPAMGKNLPVWDTQVAQLDAVLRERRAGVEPAPRQAQPAPPGLFGEQPELVIDQPSPRSRWARWWQRSDPELITWADDRELLDRWSGGGPVGVLDVDGAGVIRSVPHVHPALGIDDTLIGSPMVALLGVMERARGAPAWLLDLERRPERIVRTVVLSHERPERGATGIMVRSIHRPSRGGSTLLVAEDQIYQERPVAVAVQLQRRVDEGSEVS